jgi:hypothetical protein
MEKSLRNIGGRGGQPGEGDEGSHPKGEGRNESVKFVP